MRYKVICLGMAALVALLLPLPVMAHAPSGAIFTTVADGSEVNFNIYPSKEAVYLDGGPGPGAPASAAGLDAGTYVFQVTDPSGRTLLSTDPARCRQFTVDGSGLIMGVVAQLDGCEHATGFDVDHGATTVQLMPYNDTPNPGGVYKVWVTRVEDYACFPNLNQRDCNRRGSKHGFVPSHTKTDNFKVRDPRIVEIDTTFFNDLNGNGHRDANEERLLGRYVNWTDTVGGSNVKWSYNKPELLVEYQTHVEAPEAGIHYITIPDQAGCKVGLVHVDDIDGASGPQTVAVEIFSTDYSADRDRTVSIYVACTVP